MIHLSTHDARRLGTRLTSSGGLAYETWVIHEKEDPGASIAQVQLFRHKGAWVFWSGNVVRASIRALGHELEAALNAG